VTSGCLVSGRTGEWPWEGSGLGGGPCEGRGGVDSGAWWLGQLNHHDSSGAPGHGRTSEWQGLDEGPPVGTAAVGLQGCDEVISSTPAPCRHCPVF
jgi:hypothetical protein